MFLLLHFDMVKAQNSQVSSADSIVILQQEQVVDIRNDVSILVFDIDTLKRDVSSLYDEVKSLTNDVDVYVNGNTSRWNWDAIGSLLSVVSIIVMIIVYILTRRQTNKQIENQKKDTERKFRIQKLLTKKQIDALFKNTKKQIEEQRKLNNEQIKQMQEDSVKRTNNLKQLGQQIQKSTNAIRESVKNLEQRFLTERDRIRIEVPYSTIISNYDALAEDLENEYAHFTTNPKESIIHQRASRVKDGIRRITQILSNYSSIIKVPDVKTYLDSIDEVVNKPSFRNKRKQIDSFKIEGKKYHDQLNTCIQNLFNNK